MMRFTYSLLSAALLFYIAECCISTQAARPNESDGASGSRGSTDNQLAVTPEAGLNANAKNTVGDLGIVPHPGPYPTVKVLFDVLLGRLAAGSAKKLSGKYSYDRCHKFCDSAYVQFSDLTNNNVPSNPISVWISTNSDCTNPIRGYTYNTDYPLGIELTPNDGVIVGLTHVDVSNLYYVTLTEAIDPNMTHVTDVYNGYTAVCYNTCHTSPSSSCMYTVVNEAQIRYSVYTSGDCSGNPLKVIDLSSKAVINDNGYFGTSSVIYDQNQMYPYNWCQIYVGPYDPAIWVGLVQFNTCTPDPLGYGYLHATLGADNMLYTQYFYDDKCTENRMVYGKLPMHNSQVALLLIRTDHNGGFKQIPITYTCFNYA